MDNDFEFVSSIFSYLQSTYNEYISETVQRKPYRIFFGRK